ncbi:hypothetical protein [Streptomyces chartreusis]|uniref:Uncharacterized protein n=1 Tax=Streptomyces chartreusis TaxID=1969 RepID=A0A7H8TK13_STRCX|nr:hypothetical protein [Streptomyces chartreusis]QKZ23861.1 hypothetical protein HUT05_44820 [Streptomyces chartreusis]
MSASASRTKLRLSAISSFLCLALIITPDSPEASALDLPRPDICDLPGCGALEKGVDAVGEFGLDVNQPAIDAAVAGKKTYDLATDPLGYFSEKFAETNGQLIKELGGELKK